MNPTYLCPFVDASAMLKPNRSELSYGCMMADFDKDGYPEILVVNVSAPNRLYKWDDSALRDVAPPVLQDIEGYGIGVAAGDLTGNGWLDIYILNTSAFMGPYSQPDRLLLNQGGLEFIDAFDGFRGRNVAAGRSVCFFDPNGNGRYGAYVCNYMAPCRLYMLDEQGKLLDFAPEMELDQVTGGRAAVAADFRNTGRMDLFTGNENDANRLFRNDGEGNFHDVAKELGLDDPFENVRGLQVCDFNRDGIPDLVWGNWEGPHRLMRQNPDGTFVNVAGDDFQKPSRVRTVIVFDYDNDGWEDIFINNIGQPNRLFHNNGDGSFTEVDAGPLSLPMGCGTGATCGDLNGDGFLDLFISHGESEASPNALFLNSPNGNNWLRIHPLTPNGAPAIGARVIVYPEGDSRPIMRFLDGGSGYLCQMEPVAHAGLAQATKADRVEVRFTNGKTCTIHNVDANQNVYITPTDDDFQIRMVKDDF